MSLHRNRFKTSSFVSAKAVDEKPHHNHLHIGGSMLTVRAVLLAAPLLAGATARVVHGRFTALPPGGATAWVKAHENVLPSSLADFSRFPSAYRHAIYSALPATAREHLWHQQLQYYAARHDLTAEQRAFVRVVDDSLDEVLSALSPDSTTAARGRVAVEAIAARGRSLFDTDKAKLIFGDLGVNTPLESASTARTQESSYCSCHQGGDWCGCGELCADPINGWYCIPLDYGCGWFLAQSCTGQCV